MVKRISTGCCFVNVHLYLPSSFCCSDLIRRSPVLAETLTSFRGRSLVYWDGIDDRPLKTISTLANGSQVPTQPKHLLHSKRVIPETRSYSNPTHSSSIGSPRKPYFRTAMSKKHMQINPWTNAFYKCIGLYTKAQISNDDYQNWTGNKRIFSDYQPDLYLGQSCGHYQIQGFHTR